VGRVRGGRGAGAAVALEQLDVHLVAGLDAAGRVGVRAATDADPDLDVLGDLDLRRRVRHGRRRGDVHLLERNGARRLAEADVFVVAGVLHRPVVGADVT